MGKNQSLLPQFLEVESQSGKWIESPYRNGLESWKEPIGWGGHSKIGDKAGDKSVSV